MRVMMLIGCLLLGCSEDALQLPDSGGGLDARPDTGTTMKDAEPNEDASTTADAAEIEDTGTLPPDAGEDADGGSEDTGPADAGAVVCAALSRDTCLATVGCVLDGSEDQDPGYRCRDALSPCELIKNPNECESSPACNFINASCYCPENAVCICGGGRPESCRESCGGIAGTPCPVPEFFCELPMGDGTGGGAICIGNGDQLGTCVPIPVNCNGTPQSEVCGCESYLNPVTYPDDCERRRATASFGALGPC